MSDPFTGYFRSIMGDPFATDSSAPQPASQPPVQLPSQRIAPYIPPVQQPQGRAVTGATYDDSPGPGLDQAWQPDATQMQNAQYKKTAQGLVDRGKAAEVQMYLEKMSRTLPANDPRKSIYDFLLASNRYDDTMGNAIKSLRLEQQPVDSTPVPANVERKVASADITPQTIQPGYMVAGYRYIGGNPKDQRSWVKQ